MDNEQKEFHLAPATWKELPAELVEHLKTGKPTKIYLTAGAYYSNECLELRNVQLVIEPEAPIWFTDIEGTVPVSEDGDLIALGKPRFPVIKDKPNG